MKSLQNEYNLVKEGKGSEELFLKEARKLFPTVVTNVLTFDQAIHNLNERGIIVESKNTSKILQTQQPNWFNVFNENTKANNTKVDPAIVEKETAGYNYKDKKNSNNISTAEILTGYYVELKDPKNAEKTESELQDIVLKNLEKNPLHYVENGQFGVKDIGYIEDTPGLGKTKEVKGKYKSSGMEPVKLNEGVDIYVSSDDHFKVKHNEKTWDVEYHNHKEGDSITLSRGIEKIKGKVMKVTPDGDITINLSKVNESNHGDKAELDLYKSELNFLSKVKTTAERHTKRKAELKKKIADLKSKMNEAMYGDSDGDYDANQDSKAKAEMYYDKGVEAYSEGDYIKADQYYKLALKYGNSLSWTEQDLPPYGDEHLGEVDMKNKTPMQINPKYTHFVIRKSDNKVVDGWDYKGLDNDEIKHWVKIDLKDNFPDQKPSEFTILTKAGLIKKGIDPNNTESWYKLDEQDNHEWEKETEPLAEAKRKAVEKHLKEIDKLGEIASVAHKIEKINEKLEELTSKLTVTEGDDLKDVVDKKAVKEIKKDIALYEKKKTYYKKIHSKLSKRMGVEPAQEEAPIMEVETIQNNTWEGLVKEFYKRKMEVK